MGHNKSDRLRLPPKEYKLLCYAIHTRDGWKCRVCKTRNSLHAHHIIYRSHGGDDVSENLITLCNNCHEAVHARFLVIYAPDGLEVAVNANKQVRFLYLSGWTPNRKVR